MSEIVVGVDGSEGARHALAWAASEAALRGANLTALLVWQVPARTIFGPDWPGLAKLDQAIEAQRTREERALREACSALLRPLGERATCTVAEGPPAPVLLQAAEKADLLVVGTRGRGGFSELLLGSVSQQCALHAPCPVVIVPPPPHHSS